MARIELASVWKRYGEVVAVRDVDLRVGDGEYISLLGPSGCGKTSTMRMIAGLESITEGTIAIDGVVVNGRGPSERNIAMAFENYGLYPHMSVFGNIAYPLRIRGGSDQAILRAVVRTADQLKISDLLGRRPKELSTGVQQRISLARALVRQPAVFLLDEPLSHLDAELRSEMRAELKILQAQSGGTFIHVSHDQLEALSLADRIAIMNDGVLQQVGSPSEVYHRPANRFVATFIGEPPMNILKGEIVPGEDPALVVEGMRLARLDRALAADILAASPNGAVDVGVRPRDLMVGSDGADLLGGRVRVREGHGESALLTVDTREHRLRVEAPPDVPLHDGDTVSLDLMTTRVHYFEPETGRAIGRSGSGLESSRPEEEP